MSIIMSFIDFERKERRGGRGGERKVYIEWDGLWGRGKWRESWHLTKHQLLLTYVLPGTKHFFRMKNLRTGHILSWLIVSFNTHKIFIIVVIIVIVIAVYNGRSSIWAGGEGYIYHYRDCGILKKNKKNKWRGNHKKGEEKKRGRERKTRMNKGYVVGERFFLLINLGHEGEKILLPSTLNDDEFLYLLQFQDLFPCLFFFCPMELPFSYSSCLGWERIPGFVVVGVLGLATYFKHSRYI